MTLDQIKRLLAEGEGLTVEYKKCADGLSNSVFETVCSFSNRYGGYIFLGVEDNGAVAGVNRNAVADIKKNFVNMLNNPQKISPTLFLTLDETEIDGKVVLYVYVPMSSQVELCSDKVYDRTEDADIDITKSTDMVANLYRRKSSVYTEREVFPYVTEKELRLDLMPRVRQMALSHYPEHPWENMSDGEIMKSAGLYEEDWRTGKKGFNLAAVLLFGRDDVIRSCAPGYVTDAILRRENLDRYDDRLMAETNLIESYDLLMEFIAKHTSDKFFLIEDRRVSVRTWIAREIVSNILVHREYSSPFPSKIVIEKDRIYAENWNKARRHGRIDPEDFVPYPKNPLLARFFVNIGRADKLGSGVRNLYRYTKIYSGGEPELIEGDVFRTIVPLDLSAAQAGDKMVDIMPENGAVNDALNGAVNENGAVNDALNGTQNSIFELIARQKGLRNEDLTAILSKGRRTIQRNIKVLVDKGLIVRVGSDKTGYWEVKK
ncbi:ATP-dependent DNA helicase RecG [Synergistales bacterium]|nr:ATP-dependent DNA helicase RecG [Synergistales bacterium]